jgi:two-component system phosphate regulon response regulator PhoB
VSSVPHVLIVDDELDLARLIEFNLKAAGLETSHAADGESALRAAQQRVPDLVLLDLMLPGVNGTEVCRQLKRNPKTRHVPVIMLTAKGEELDRVVGFELGADDYVTKPFSVRELVLRCQAVLRRNGPQAATESTEGKPERRRVGGVEIDTGAHRAFVDGEEVVLTALEFRLLQHFMERLGRVQTREQLLEDVWQMSSELETRTVDTHVKRLREKLGSARDTIETVRGVGYRMAAPGDAA